MAVAVTTQFIEWLERELSARGSDRTKLAAGIGKKPQTVYAWYNEGRTPSPELCRLIAGYLRIPVEDVLRHAGHLPADAEAGEPPIPAWLTSLLEELDGYELRVVGETARGLLQLREERAQYAAPPEPPPPAAPPAPQGKGPRQP